MNSVISTILITVAILAVIFLILREVNCWYWKINERISLQQEQNSILEKILTELKNESNKNKSTFQKKGVDYNIANTSNEDEQESDSGRDQDTDINTEIQSKKTFDYNAPSYKIEKISENNNLFGGAIEKYLIKFDDNEKGIIYLNIKSKHAYFKGKPEGYWTNIKYTYTDMDSCINALHYFLKNKKELAYGLISKY